jgi:hypothetical protein
VRLGDVVVAPGVQRAVAIDWTDYIGDDDEISGSPSWSAATGLEIEGTPTFSDPVATVIVTPSQEGCDYNLVCAITLASGATEEGLVVVKCRTGEEDPRLTR